MQKDCLLQLDMLYTYTYPAMIEAGWEAMSFPYKTTHWPSWSHFAMYQGQQHTSPPDRYKDAADLRPRTAEGRDRPLTLSEPCEQCKIKT